jgi:hypothetical protein
MQFANEIERRFGSKGLHSTSVMPGGIHTALSRHMDPKAVAGWNTPENVRQMKSIAQGSATTIWAAIGAEWESTGGKYLEDVSVATLRSATEKGLLTGHAAWAYDEQGEKSLWEISNKLVKFEEDK